ncbi:MAG: UDP-glucose 6-dehydrogenase 1 [Trichoglossum hirsutum]|nr:MAG: UDP-glucose 6-dehydrogenase 1 [Trichoglossum hirsutum]
MDNNFSMFRFNQLGGDDIDSFSSNGSNRSASPSLLFRVPPNSLVETEVSEIGVSDALHKEVREIACIGAGYVGGPTGAIIAYKNPSIQVTIADQNAERIEAWKSNKLPIYEPGLDHIVSTARDGVVSPLIQPADSGNGGNPVTDRGDCNEEILGSLDLGHTPNLFFTTDVTSAIAKADLIFVCVNTPTKKSGIGKDHACDLKYFEAATRKIAEAATSDKIIVEKSTVPCRTAQRMREILEANCNPGVKFEVLSNPEFSSEGSAVSDLLNPDRVLIGSDTSATGANAAARLSHIYSWVPRDRIVFMSLWSSELSKLAANALLAQRISSINALSAICEATGANINEISYACGLDRRIGPHMLKASVGFGGSCFRKDILSLVYLAESLHLSEVADYWRSVVAMNEYQKCRLTRRIIHCLFDTLTDKKITILGFSYKKDTCDTRETPAITLVRNILAERSKISIYDPQVLERQIWQELVEGGSKLEELKNRITIHHDVYEACEGADAVIVATEWDEFSNKAITPNGPSAWTPSTILRGGARTNGNRSHIPTNQVVCSETFPSCVSPPAISLLGGSGTPSRLPTSIDSVICRDDSPSRNPRHSLRNRLPSATSRGRQGSYVSSPSTEGASERTDTIALCIGGDGEENKMNRLDWSRVASGMRKPMFIFDGRGILDADKLKKLGFRVEAIGVPGARY